MVLILGGAAAGKREYILSMGYVESDIADGVMDASPALINLQRIVFDDPSHAMELVGPLLQKEVVASDEVGSGIIPMSRREREGREAAGRLCVLLAQRADKVIRVVAGIPILIKG